MPDEPVAPTAPAGFNEDALLANVRNTVTSAIADAREQGNAQIQQRQAQQQQANQWAADPVAQTLAPYLQPMAQQMNLRVQAAEDKGDFYLGHPEAGEYKGEIESMFNQLMTQGRPMEREAVWFYFRGRNAEMFAEKAAKSNADQLATAARSGVSIGGSDMSRPGSAVDLANFGSLPLEKKRELIGNTPF
jgi:hypothetical protein